MLFQNSPEVPYNHFLRSLSTTSLILENNDVANDRAESFWRMLSSRMEALPSRYVTSQILLLQCFVNTLSPSVMLGLSKHMTRYILKRRTPILTT